MSVHISCPSCQAKLSVPSDLASTAKVKCPKCGQTIPIRSKKILTPERAPPAVEQRPPLSRNSPAATSFASTLLPASSILVALFSLALPIFLGEYMLGMILACLAALGSVAGLLLAIFGRAKAVGIHLAAAAVTAAAFLVAVNALMLKGSIETNEAQRTKNDAIATQAKADLDEAKKKLVEAEDAPRKAEAILKRAEEEPKKAEAFYKTAKDVQDKTDAAEKRTAESLVKIGDLERKTDQDRKKIAAESEKVELAQDKLKALQKNLDQAEKAIEDKRQELAASKKEIDADKKRADADLAALKKEIDADKKQAEEKQKETKDLLKRVEELLKGAVLSLKSKDPNVRIKTANRLAKMPAFPEAKEMVGEALVEAMFDPAPGVANAASGALEKIDPIVHPHILTLAIGQDKLKALRDLTDLGKDGKSALPALIFFHQKGQGQLGGLMTKPTEVLNSIAKTWPHDTRVGQIVLNEIARVSPAYGNHQRANAIQLLETVKLDRKDKVAALLTALKDGGLAPLVISAIEKIEPAATEAIPILTKLKLSPDDAVRQAAVKALTKIEASK